MKARKNLRRITPPSPFSDLGGIRVCSNAWAVFLMRRMDRQARVARFVTAGTIKDGVVTWVDITPPVC